MATGDELKIPVSAPGAQETAKKLQDVARAEQEIGRQAQEAGAKTRKAGQDTSQGLGAAGGAVDRVAGQLKSLVAGYLGLQGAVRVLAVLREEHEKVVQTTMRHAEAMRAVLALESMRGERPAVQKQIYDMAIRSGRKAEDVIPAYYTLASGTFGMTRERQTGLMEQALLLGRTELNAPLNDIVNLMSTMGTQAPQLSPTQIGNLATYTRDAAKATLGEMAAYMPDVLTAARAGGVGPETAAAMFSFATRRGGGVARSGTAVKSVMLSLLNPTTDLRHKLQARGMPMTGGMMARLGWLASAAPSLPEDLAAALGGRRGIEMVSSMAREPALLEAEIAGATRAMNMPGSLPARTLGEMFAESPEQRSLEQIRQAEAMTGVAHSQTDALARRARMDARQLYRRQIGIGPVGRWIAGGMEELTALGGQDLVGNEMMRGISQMVDEGYQISDILGATQARLDQKPGTAFWQAVPAGVSPADFLRGELRRRGARPLQSPGVTNNFHGGTQYINQDKHDPAGRPVAPAIAE